MTPQQITERQIAKIQRMTSAEEIDGYEEEARKRGFIPEELPALRDARQRVTPKKRKRR